MLTALKGGPLWAAVLIILAIVGACTALAYNGTLSGELWLSVITPIVVAVTGVTAAHVSGNQVTTALNMPPPGSAPAAQTPPAPVAVPASAPAPKPAEAVT